MIGRGTLLLCEDAVGGAERGHQARQERNSAT